jgi:hypothetical protein
MKQSKSIGFNEIIMIVLIFFCLPMDTNAEDEKLIDVSIALEKSKCFISEPIVAKVTITNLGTDSLLIAYHELVYRNEVKLELLTKEVQNFNLLEKLPMGGGISEIETIKPNAKLTYDIILNELVNFKTVGSFRFKINFPVSFENENTNEIKVIQVSQVMELEMIQNDLVLLDKIYNNLYESILKADEEKIKKNGERNNAVQRLCSVQDILVLKHLKLLTDSKNSGVVDSVVDALEKFGKDARPALEKIVKNEFIEKLIKLKAEKILQKLN